MQEIKDFCTSYLTKFVSNFDGILHTVETSWPDEAYIHFILSDLYSRERTLLM